MLGALKKKAAGAMRLYAHALFIADLSVASARGFLGEVSEECRERRAEWIERADRLDALDLRRWWDTFSGATEEVITTAVEAGAYNVALLALFSAAEQAKKRGL